MTTTELAQLKAITKHLLAALAGLREYVDDLELKMLKEKQK